MRKIVISLLTILSIVVAWADDKNTAMFIYRNDGDFNAFLRNEVDSMTYESSQGKADYDIQVIWTSDSVYRIPLQAIDSIAFHNPETKLCKDVFIFTTEHDPYILSTDSLKFLVSFSTPLNMIPDEGQVVCAHIDCNSFPDGFCGRVSSIKSYAKGTVISCEQAGLSDVYSQLVVCEMAETYEESGPPILSPQLGDNVSRISGVANYIINDETYTKKVEFQGATVTVSDHNRLSARVAIRILEGQKDYFQLQIRNNNVITASLDSEVTMGANQAWNLVSIKLPKIRIPQVPLFWINPSLHLDAYASLDGKVDLNYSQSFTRADRITVQCSNDVCPTTL